jgi:hypothetical protein
MADFRITPMRLDAPPNPVVRSDEESKNKSETEKERKEDAKKLAGHIRVKKILDMSPKEQIAYLKSAIKALRAQQVQVRSDIAELESLPPDDPRRAQMLPMLRDSFSALESAIKARQQELTALT